MSDELSEQMLIEFVSIVIAVQKKYAHEFSGVRNERRAEIKEELSKFVAERLES